VRNDDPAKAKVVESITKQTDANLNALFGHLVLILFHTPAASVANLVVARLTTVRVKQGQ
jgi:hypothetical protein